MLLQDLKYIPNSPVLQHQFHVALLRQTIATATKRAHRALDCWRSVHNGLFGRKKIEVVRDPASNIFHANTRCHILSSRSRAKRVTFGWRATFFSPSLLSCAAAGCLLCSSTEFETELIHGAFFISRSMVVSAAQTKSALSVTHTHSGVGGRSNSRSCRYYMYRSPILVVSFLPIFLTFLISVYFLLSHCLPLLSYCLIVWYYFPSLLPS